MPAVVEGQEGRATGGAMLSPDSDRELPAKLFLAARDLAKGFGGQGLFRGVSFELAAGEALVVTGRNGSGKSTLLRILCGLLRPTRGTVEYRAGDRRMPGRDVRRLVGLVSPDLMLYEELTLQENLRFFARVRGLRRTDADLDALLTQVGLEGEGARRAETLSTGMRQRLRFAYALLHDPPVLLLDEPTANLDEAGTAMARACMARQRARGILVVATNNREELDLGDQILRLGG
jgi:heme exporter protein A